MAFRYFLLPLACFFCGCVNAAQQPNLGANDEVERVLSNPRWKTISQAYRAPVPFAGKDSERVLAKIELMAKDGRHEALNFLGVYRGQSELDPLAGKTHFESAIKNGSEVAKVNAAMVRFSEELRSLGAPKFDTPMSESPLLAELNRLSEHSADAAESLAQLLIDASPHLCSREHAMVDRSTAYRLLLKAVSENVVDADVKLALLEKMGGTYFIANEKERTRLLNNAASEGSSIAQLCLAVEAVEEESQLTPAAKELLEQAAKSNFINAQYMLGVLLISENHYGLAPKTEAIDKEIVANLTAVLENTKVYQSTSPDFRTEARYWMGFMYLNGFGVPEDVDRGVKLIQESASAGFSRAILHVGKLHEYGLRLEYSTQLATQYYEKAARLGNSDAAAYLKRIESKITDRRELLRRDQKWEAEAKQMQEWEYRQWRRRQP